jgi:hypothetical protein
VKGADEVRPVSQEFGFSCTLPLSIALPRSTHIPPCSGASLKAPARCLALSWGADAAPIPIRGATSAQTSTRSLLVKLPQRHTRCKPLSLPPSGREPTPVRRQVNGRLASDAAAAALPDTAVVRAQLLPDGLVPSDVRHDSDQDVR